MLHLKLQHGHCPTVRGEKHEALIRITQSLVRDQQLDKVNIGLDFFDATINRIAAWVIGSRNTIKGILMGMLAPIEDLKAAELAGDYTKRLAVTEALKTYPIGAVWDYYCVKHNVPLEEDWLADVQHYEKEELFTRN